MIKVTWNQPSDTPLRVPDSKRKILSRVRGQGKEIRITIEPVYKLRTDDQNAIFHAKINMLSRECGGDREWIKEQVKELAIQHGYPYEVVSGKVVPKSSSEVTIEEMEILIDSLYEYAYLNGCYIGEKI